MNVSTRGVHDAASARSGFVKVSNPILLIDTSAWVFVHGHVGVGVIQKKEKQDVNEEIHCLHYGMFEEGTPGRPALSNQAH